MVTAAFKRAGIYCLALLLSLVSLSATGAYAGQVNSTQRAYISNNVNDARHWPQSCDGRKVCHLVGPGGLVIAWKGYITMNAGKTFLVDGRCASACAIALGYAIYRGEHVIVRPGATIVPHNEDAIRGARSTMPGWYYKLLTGVPELASIDGRLVAAHLA